MMEKEKLGRIKAKKNSPGESYHDCFVFFCFPHLNMISHQFNILDDHFHYLRYFAVIFFYHIVKYTCLGNCCLTLVHHLQFDALPIQHTLMQLIKQK